MSSLSGKMLPLFRMGLGGNVGSGAQYLSWVSIDDAVRACEFAMRRDDVTGPVNVCSPNPVTNAQFTGASVYLRSELRLLALVAPGNCDVKRCR